MNEKQAYIIDRLKQFLIDHYNPDMVILYGSTARGDTDEFSDIDMMVVMDVENSENLTVEILAKTDHIVHDKHIMLRSGDDYFNQRDIPGTMVYSALSEGMILYQNPDFNTDDADVKSYEIRKRDVIQSEYLNQAYEFLEQGESALESRQLFRCRDFLKFAAVRALKAVLVFSDVHPPRTIDLMILFENARDLVPVVEKSQPVIEKLNNYCPAGNSPEEISKCRDIAGKMRFVIDSISSILEQNS